MAGLRPDAIQPLPTVNDLPEAWHAAAKVSVSEVLGGRSLLELDLGEQSLIAETAGHLLAEPGSPLTVALDLNRLHLFDRDSEASLTAGSDAAIQTHYM